jgi:hypothetical protein
MKPEVRSRVTEVSYCALPDDDINAEQLRVRVQWRGAGRYAVLLRSLCLATDGTWEYEHISSERTEEWLNTHRFGYDEACALAAAAALTVTCNGLNAEALMAWAERHRTDPGAPTDR